MFAQFTHLVAQASGWAYLVVLLLAIIDALLPVVPSETAVITAGVVASAGRLSLPVILILAATGAFVGDNLAYGLGRRYGPQARERFFHGRRADHRIAWATRQLDDRGGELIAVGRFIPGGRTAITLTAGLTRFPWRRFALFDAGAAAIWAAYAGLLGYLGGQAFEDQPWKGLLLALAIAFAVGAATEAVRWARRRRKQRRSSHV